MVYVTYRNSYGMHSPLCTEHSNRRDSLSRYLRAGRCGATPRVCHPETARLELALALSNRTASAFWTAGFYVYESFMMFSVGYTQIDWKESSRKETGRARGSPE